MWPLVSFLPHLFLRVFLGFLHRRSLIGGQVDRLGWLRGLGRHQSRASHGVLVPGIVIVSGVRGVMVDAMTKSLRAALYLSIQNQADYEKIKGERPSKSGYYALVSESMVLSLLVFTVLRTAVISDFVYP